jgi:hypothetical protein
MNSMQKVGISLLVIGVLLGLFALNMDTSVATEGRYGFPERVVNISLMEQRRTLLMLAGLAVLIGAIFTGLSYSQQTQQSWTNHPRNQETRACPFCAEEIKQAATVCKHCQRDVPPEDVNSHDEAEISETDRLDYPEPPNIGKILYGIERRITERIETFCLDESGAPKAGALALGFIFLLIFICGTLYIVELRVTMK